LYSINKKDAFYALVLMKVKDMVKRVLLLPKQRVFCPHHDTKLSLIRNYSQSNSWKGIKPSPFLILFPRFSAVHSHIKAPSPWMLHYDQIDPIPDFPSAADRIKFKIIGVWHDIVGDISISSWFPPWKHFILLTISKDFFWPIALFDHKHNNLWVTFMGRLLIKKVLKIHTIDDKLRQRQSCWIGCFKVFVAS